MGQVFNEAIWGGRQDEAKLMAFRNLRTKIHLMLFAPNTVIQYNNNTAPHLSLSSVFTIILGLIDCSVCVLSNPTKRPSPSFSLSSENIETSEVLGSFRLETAYK